MDASEVDELVRALNDLTIEFDYTLARYQTMLKRYGMDSIR